MITDINKQTHILFNYNIAHPITYLTASYIGYESLFHITSTTTVCYEVVPYFLQCTITS